MRLTKLELQGFKSFADQTEFNFEPGVTAIVGPNGCGKSNVSDAVRWVLGEQRARALRGAKMEEVIFQGSSARRPVNIAEVSLHFENDDGGLDVPFREVVVTRRLSRSGESEYFLNRSACRLRDIHDMMRGTGLGADAGVVIEARMIDALLSDKPDERRELFEEAAGVSLYRDRKRTAERRLEETTVDLSRLDDLLSEVQSQVRSLARQRKKAERAEEISKRRFTVEIALAAREMASWHGELADLGSKVEQQREAAPRAEADVTRAEAARDAAHGLRAATEAQRAELTRLAAEQRDALDSLRREIMVAEERQRHALMRREKAELEHREGGAVAERVAAEKARAADDRAQLEYELTEAIDAVQKEVGAEEEVRGALAAARAALEAAERKARDLAEHLHRLTLDRDAAERELGELEQRLVMLSQEEQQLRETASGLAREMDSARDGLEIARTRLASAQASATEAEEAVRVARDSDAIARAELLSVGEEQTAMEARMHALDALETERVGLAPAAARLLEARHEFGDGAVLGPLSDFITAGSAAAGLVERFLGAGVHAVLVRDAAVAEAVREWHLRTNPGPLMLLPADRAPDVASSQEADELIRSVTPAAPADRWVRALLGGTRPIGEGTAFVDARGAVWLPGAIAGPGPLRRKAELGELADRLTDLRGRQAESAARSRAARHSLAAAEAVFETASAAVATATRDTRQAEDRFSELSRQHQRAARELTEAAAARARIDERRGDLARRMTAVDTQLVAQREHTDERDAEIAAARELLVEAERRQEAARDRRTEAQVAKAQAEARLQVAQDRERHLDEELASASTRVESLVSELSTLSQSDAHLGEQLAKSRLDLEARDATYRDVEARMAAAELGVKTTDEDLTRAEHELDEIRRRAVAAREELHVAELRHSELSGRKTSIRERLEAEWRKPLDELLASAEPLEVSDDELRAEAAELREQADALGPVNPLAIEEHDEESKRLDFLTAQRADLTSAKASLHQAIREIDVTARDLFLTTFVAVRENFKRIFVTLFGGGECDLRLENPDTPLEGDIEIHASPRGKRTQRIHLLSSGERALVALSLLFGIFLNKPSPFCLLDEVDAPLDDQNIGRFVRMLNEFKKKTQFIVITHNPRTTTEAADAVYGVTMQEPGVSSLVSVRLTGERADGTAEAEARDESAASLVA
ncbi:MAG TPA: chromosome segregation protein SMC [Gemmatimonadaceae bacterium]|nr:chromosome segregation protein SMC [Gemmatimonadaceae bacterium]